MFECCPAGWTSAAKPVRRHWFSQMVGWYLSERVWMAFATTTPKPATPATGNGESPDTDWMGSEQFSKSLLRGKSFTLFCTLFHALSCFNSIYNIRFTDSCV